MKDFYDVHGDAYDYSLVSSIRYDTKIKILCKTHGIFEQLPNHHKQGRGCKLCGHIRNRESTTKSLTECIEDFKSIHGDKYDYSDVVYQNSYTKIEIVCPDHGPFFQKPNGHMNGNGCPECGNESHNKALRKERDPIAEQRRAARQKSQETLMDKLKLQEIVDVHGSRRKVSELLRISSATLNKALVEHGVSTYCFPKAVYEVLSDKSKLSEMYKTKSTEQIGQELSVDPSVVCDYLEKHGLKRNNWFNTSSGENSLADFVKSLGFTVDRNNRSRLKGKEIDILVSDLSIGVEYHGLYYHSEKFKGKNYHKDKHYAAEETGIRLIHIWEDDWRDKRKVVEKMLKAKLGVSSQPSVFARKCEIIESNFSEASQFLEENHIQGSGPAASMYLGLRYNKELVALCMFKRRNEYEYELNRYATSCNVPGGFSKLVSCFQKQYPEVNLVSFADKMISEGNLYSENGWNLEGEIAPDYMYLHQGIRKHKFGFRLKRFKEDPSLIWAEGLSESQLAELNNLPRIYDAGKLKFIKRPIIN